MTRASVQGLEKVEEARKQKKWKCQDTRWYMTASVSLPVLKRFRAGDSVGKDAFIAICKAVGIDNWQEIVDDTVQETELAISSSSTDSSTLDPNFVGRENAIAELNTLVSQGKKVILIQAEGGVGKTILATKYLKTQQFDLVLPHWMAKERKNITSVESMIEEWLKRYFDEEPGREFGITLERLRHKLRDGSKKIGILIDNLEPALENGRFIEEHRRYVELMRVLTEPEVQSVTLITSREPLYENSSVWLYQLSELSKEAWNQFFESCNINTGSSLLSNTSVLEQMHQAYGGNAEAMFVLSGAIQHECQGDLETYWQENGEDLLINPTLENLVKSQFNKLQQDNEQAYRFLCRLGCFRYQDVPSVPKEGIFYLLWDVQEERRKRVVKALRDRSLVKVCNDEYYLHPVIRAEAINRLRKSEDWETANRKAANFWTDSVTSVETVEDAWRALEAYYHFIEIRDFELAGDVIATERSNQWEKDEALGRAFYRFGLLKQIVFLITQIIDDVESGYNLSSLYNTLGDLYWMMGRVQEAIECHEKSKKISVAFDIKDFEILSLFNIGLCKIDLWALEEAQEALELVISLNLNSNFYIYIIDSYWCLAFVNSCLGYNEKAYYLAEKACCELLTSERSAWSQGYSLLFLGLTYKNLGEIEKSFEMFRQAFAFAEESHYTQVKGKALDGLAQLYREQGEFETALSNHAEAIKILDKIGAKCDLAEAYYQRGLTYQKMGEVENSQANFDKAIQLFSEMEAPKQIEKVQRAMESGG